jgi:hypothetical protein
MNVRTWSNQLLKALKPDLRSARRGKNPATNLVQLGPDVGTASTVIRDEIRRLYSMAQGVVDQQSAAAGSTATTNKYVYFFGDGRADGNGKMKDVLGGKGAGLAEMTNAGLPVPPGFTIQTEACREYMRGKVSKQIDVEMLAALD